MAKDYKLQYISTVIPLISLRYTCALGSCDAVWKAKLRLGCSVGLCADQAALDERKLIKDGLFRGVQGPKR